MDQINWQRTHGHTGKRGRARPRGARLLAAVLAVCLLFSACTAYAAGSDDPLAGFEDVSTHWARPAIRFCVENGYITAIDGGRFDPDGIVSRALLVQSLYNMAGCPSAAGMDCPFTDIAGHENRRAIFWAYNAGIVSGGGDLAFDPDAPVSREEAAVMFKRYREYSLGEEVALYGSYLDRFTDRRRVSSWAEDSMNWAVQSGLMSGSGPDTLSPQGTCTRAQLAQFIRGYFEPFQSLSLAVEQPEEPDSFSSKYARNSGLVSYTRLSPNHSGQRNHSIDTITIHCMAGNMSVEECGELFADPSRQASSNYGIGSDGRIALYVDEGNRSWCSSSASNDNRAVTIEVANIGGAPDWPVSSLAYEALIDLVTDICQRNGIRQLLWQGDPSLIGQVDRQNMTVHRWFANKSCPGEYLYSRHSDIAAQVNKRLLAAQTAEIMGTALSVYDNAQAKGGTP